MDFESRSEFAEGRSRVEKETKQIIGMQSSKAVDLPTYADILSGCLNSGDNSSKSKEIGIRVEDTSGKEVSLQRPTYLRKDPWELLTILQLQKGLSHRNRFPNPRNNFITVNGDNDVTDDEDEDLEEPVQDNYNTLLHPSKRLDVLPFLSNHGMTTRLVRFDPSKGFEGYDINQAINGKYVVIACFSIPLVIYEEEADCARAMIASYPELASSHDFEMVVVVKMKKGFEDNIGEYIRFVSAFPCPAIPFEDVETRKSICSNIGFQSNCSAVLVDPCRIILQYQSTHLKFLHYGSEWFPFEDSSIKHLRIQDRILNFRLDPFYKDRFFKDTPTDVPDTVWRLPSLGEPLSLCKDILLCDPAFKLNRAGPAGESICVSELSNKYVGLYLCMHGEFMSKLNDAHQHCIQNNQQLEIVLVCLPIFEDVEKYYIDLRAALRDYNITSWLLFPFENKVSRRIWRAFGQKVFDDKFIILPPNSNSGEQEGKAIITRLGVDQYPFTRTSVRERRLASLKSLTPTLLFRSTSTGHTCLSLHGVDDPEVVCESQIRGKRLLVYLDLLRLMEDDRKLYRLLLKHYPDIQRHGCEVVFVPLDVHVKTPPPHFPNMPWPCMPCSAAVQNSVVRQLMFKDEKYGPHIMAFEKDGRIVSRKVEDRLISHGFGEHLFKDMLYVEITAHLTSILD